MREGVLPPPAAHLRYLFPVEAQQLRNSANQAAWVAGRGDDPAATRLGESGAPHHGMKTFSNSKATIVQ